VSFADIAQNPLLARAARAELGTGGPDPPAAAAGGAAAKAPQPEAEVPPMSAKRPAPKSRAFASHMTAPALLFNTCMSLRCYRDAPRRPPRAGLSGAARGRRRRPSARPTRWTARPPRRAALGASWPRYWRRAWTRRAAPPRSCSASCRRAPARPLRVFQVQLPGGRELAALLAARLDAAHRASEKLLSVLQARPAPPS